MVLDFYVIGERIKKARKCKNMTQEDLAEKMEVSVPFLSRVERGDIKLNLNRLAQLCKILEVSMGSILDGTTYDSNNYLSDDFSNLLKNCPPEKTKLIYSIVRLLVTSDETPVKRI